ncbi:MAG: lysozyme inhibitor LprI family protein [Aestuariivirga sp.]
MKKPSVVDQIAELKGRSRNWTNYHQAATEIETLKREWDKIRDTSTIFANYIPIRLVTCLEVIFRSFVRQLIDHDKTYAERSKGTLNNFRIDFDFLLGLEGRRVTVGELISHHLPFNNIEQVLAILNHIDPDILTELPKVLNRWAVEVEGHPASPIIGNYDETIKSIGQLLSVRHILAHELPFSRPFEDNELDGLFRGAGEFADSLSWRLDYLINGNSPLTQYEMNSHAADEAESASVKMNREFELLRAKEMFDDDLLSVSQGLWEQFCEAECRLVSSQVEGGSMYPMVFASTRAELLEERTRKLRQWIEKEEGDI